MSASAAPARYRAPARSDRLDPPGGSRSGLRLLGRLSRAERDGVAGRTSLRRLDRGGFLLLPEGRAPLYVIERGTVELGIVAPDGRRATTAVLGPGDAFGGPWSLGSWAGAEMAVALEASVLLCLPAGELRAWLGRSPRLALAVLDLASARTRELGRALADLLSTDAAGRVAGWLCRLADRRGMAVPGGVEIGPPLTQEDLARMAACSRETVNRALAEFSGRGWVRTAGHRYVVLDPGSLRRRSEPGRRSSGRNPRA